MLCFVVVMQSCIMNSHEVFIHIYQGCFAGTGAIVRLPQCQWSKPGGYGKISQCITTTNHSKAKTVCTFLGIYCMLQVCRLLHLVVVSLGFTDHIWYCRSQGLLILWHYVTGSRQANIGSYIYDMITESQSVIHVGFELCRHCVIPIKLC